MRTEKRSEIRITRRDVEELHERYGAQTRTLATRLLGGDPFAAEEITCEAFRGLLGERPRRVAPGERLAAWFADEVVRLCLLRTGNRAVADWWEYLANHPDEERKQAPKAAVARPRTAATVAAVPAAQSLRTRKARETLRRELAREERAPSSAKTASTETR